MTYRYLHSPLRVIVLMFVGFTSASEAALHVNAELLKSSKRGLISKVEFIVKVPAIPTLSLPFRAAMNCPSVRVVPIGRDPPREKIASSIIGRIHVIENDSTSTQHL